MLYTRNNLKKFVKEVLKENKKSFLIHEYEPGGWCDIMSAIAELKENNPAAAKLLSENRSPVGGVVARGTPEYLPGEEPINVGKNIHADDAAGKILASIDAVIEMDVEDYQSQGYGHQESLEMAQRNAAETLEVVLNDLDNH